MKPDRKSVEEVLERNLPSAAREEMEWDVACVLRRIQARADQAADDAVDPRIAAFERRSTFTWRRFAIIPTAAAMILSVFLAITWRQDAFALVEKVDGTLYRVADGAMRPLRVGESVGAGMRVRTEDRSGAVLKLSDGARVEMHEKSELSLEHTDNG